MSPIPTVTPRTISVNTGRGILGASFWKHEHTIHNEKGLIIDIYFRHTTPGGWVEFIDLDLEWRSPDGSLTPTASKHFNSIFMKASRESGQEACPGPLLEGWLEDAGFTDVAAQRFVWPVGTWPAEKHLVL